MSNASDFIIENGVLKKYVGPGGDVVVPEGVQKIVYPGFFGCSTIVSILFPKSLKNIEAYTFKNCSALKVFDLSATNCKIGSSVFGISMDPDALPEGLVGQIATLHISMTDAAVKTYILKKQVWDCLDDAVKYDVLMSHSAKSLAAQFKKLLTKTEAKRFVMQMLDSLTEETTAKQCLMVAEAVIVLSSNLSDKLLDAVFKKTVELKNGKRAAELLESELQFLTSKTPTFSEQAEYLVNTYLAEENISIEACVDKLKTFYDLSRGIPEIHYKDGTIVSKVVFAWLMTAHEKLVLQNDDYIVVAKNNNLSVCEEAKTVLQFIDEQSFQSAIDVLSAKDLDSKGKKVFLAYPIFRYADAACMLKISSRAKQWLWHADYEGNLIGSNAIRDAIMYNNTRAAVMLAEKIGVLDRYAVLRNMDVNTLLDINLSDVGLDVFGVKEYDLGNQVVKVKLQRNLEFIIESENGTTVKSLPKRGADMSKFEQAKKHFDEMRKSVKKIVKMRHDILLEEFFTGLERPADYWKTIYLENALLRTLAAMLVWRQGTMLFTLKGISAVTVDLKEYVLTDESISLAHPMEMKQEERYAWQKYFLDNQIQQPFEQIWEPVINHALVFKDRFRDYKFDGVYWSGLRNLGFSVNNDLYYIDSVVNVHLGTESQNIDIVDIDSSGNGRFVINSFTYDIWNRRVNSCIAYLDRAVLNDKIAADDVSIIENFASTDYTIVQVMQFIETARANNATQILAYLLEYKNEHFDALNPMDEFVLEL